ncbi:peroxidase [Sarracenia purpurea var. burkii]
MLAFFLLFLFSTSKGGHTIGIAHCPTFANRLYNFTGKGDTDPTLDRNYIARLKLKCKPGDTTTTVEMVPRSSKRFDADYYNVVTCGQKKGTVPVRRRSAHRRRHQGLRPASGFSDRWLLHLPQRFCGLHGEVGSDWYSYR